MWKSGTWPRVVCVRAGGVKVVTLGVNAPANGAIGAPPGGVKITLGKLSAGHEVGAPGVGGKNPIDEAGEQLISEAGP